MATLAWSLIVVIRYTIFGGWIVGFYFLAFFSSGDDYYASITTDVDNVAKVTVGVVECIANLLLTSFCSDVSSHASLLITNLFRFITFHVDSNCNF